MRQRCKNGDRSARVVGVMSDKRNVTVMPFPIKKRNNTELFSDRKEGLN